MQSRNLILDNAKKLSFSDYFLMKNDLVYQSFHPINLPGIQHGDVALNRMLGYADYREHFSPKSYIEYRYQEKRK